MASKIFQLKLYGLNKSLTRVWISDYYISRSLLASTEMLFDLQEMMTIEEEMITGGTENTTQQKGLVLLFYATFSWAFRVLTFQSFISISYYSSRFVLLLRDCEIKTDCFQRVVFVI